MYNFYLKFGNQLSCTFDNKSINDLYKKLTNFCTFLLVLDNEVKNVIISIEFYFNSSTLRKKFFYITISSLVPGLLYNKNCPYVRMFLCINIEMYITRRLLKLEV